MLLIGGAAGAHQESICLQKGFAFHKLPSASPELNPVERFFEELRKELANQIFQNIEKVEDYLTSILQKDYHNPKTHYPIHLIPYIRLTN